MLGLASAAWARTGVTSDHLQGLAAGARVKVLETGGGVQERGWSCVQCPAAAGAAACCCPDKLRKYQDGGCLAVAGSAAHTRTRPDTSQQLNQCSAICDAVIGTCDPPPVVQ